VSGDRQAEVGFSVDVIQRFSYRHQTTRERKGTAITIVPTNYH
jgi:hypothetical protein